MLDSIKEYVSSPEFQELVDRMFERLGNEPIAPILDFLFYWMWVGPMLIVDYAVLPITTLIGGNGFLILVALMLTGVLFYKRRKTTAPIEHIEEVEELPTVKSHPRYGIPR